MRGGGGGDPSPARILPPLADPQFAMDPPYAGRSAPPPASAVFALFFFFFVCLLLRVCGGGGGSGLAAPSGGARSVCSGDESAVPAV